MTIVRDLMDELGYPSKSPEIVEPAKMAYYFSNEYKQSRVDSLPIAESGSVVNSAAQRNFLASFNEDGKSAGMALEIRERHSGHQFKTKVRLDDLDHDALGIISSELMGTIPPNAKWFINKILIDLYDAHDYERYEPTEGVVLNKPIISLLGGITASGLAKTFDTSDFNTGLLTRIMLVHSKDVEKGNPFEQVHDYKASTILLEQLNKVYDFKGEITISEEAKKTYKIIAMMQHNTSYDIRLTFYYNRRTLFLTKISMILALLHGRSEINRADLVTANTLLLYTEFDMPKALTEFGNTATIRIRNAIIDYLEKQLNREQGVTSKNIIENVAAKLGLSRETAITLEIQNLVQTRLITALELDSVMQYHLSKPKNTDIIEAKKVKVADDAAIPEWNISEYNMEEDTGPDWGDIKL
uniref:Uncharacterized protein n=1 Tax=uncultured Thiotrichaceae bacterium TaxID=298394 RepID=A0A6S6UI74_9GAMM|nr:MAG: Unknown protein [uncultured Thiotrichaceae bacterium]